ncbi:unnamed protein product [Zymoseptoria tritici ST99CH_1A5]|uniref:Uncharacterized protein n=2 Tax=Zymoseptoria tritici TaxID=1047171 RepID=A0A2H1G484_ZYMTR|nr:unnamed protein product [Zymoseptoria tritici ST99CH_1E4]SMY22284.1 unnamed protein product [Zymoseptoria tritici ST99CH_1A5]
MAARDIQKHFSGLRVQTARRRGRDPFATGFEDDSDEPDRQSRPKTKAPPVSKPPPATTKPRLPAASSPFAALDALQDSDDDFLDVPTKKRADRRPSPAPATLPSLRVTDGAGRRGSLPGYLPPTRKAATALAVGQLAYLDDTTDDEALAPRSRTTRRRRSPAPRGSADLDTGRTDSPRGDRPPREQPSPKQVPVVPTHTVASPFAGTKYLQDSETDTDEEAVSSRKGSTEDALLIDTPASPNKHHEVPRVDKQKQNGGGVSWRAFSAGRAEQREAEVEALAVNLQKRGRSISFCPVVTTDDGRRVPLAARTGMFSGRGKGRPNQRTKSPPRREEDVKPTDDEMADRGPVRGLDGIDSKIGFTADTFAVTPFRRSQSDGDNGGNVKRPGLITDCLPDIRVDDVAYS